MQLIIVTKKIHILVVCFLLSLLIPVYGDETQKTVITFDEYIMMVRNNLEELRLNSVGLELVKNEYNKTLSVHDVDFDVTMSGVGTKTYPDGQMVELDYSAGFRAESSLSTRLMSGTGIKIGGEYTQLYTWGNVTGSEPTFDAFGMLSGFNETKDSLNTTGYDPVVKITVTQSLLQNCFGFLDRAGKKNAKLAVSVEQLQKDLQDAQVINDYKKLYVLWIGRGEIITFIESNIDYSQKLETDALARLKAGLADEDELYQIKYLRNRLQEQYHQAATEHRVLTKRLAQVLGAAHYIPDAAYLTRHYADVSGGEFAPVDYEATKTYRIMQLTQEQLAFLKKVKFYQTLPQLNLFADVGIKFHRFNQRIDDTEKTRDYYGDVDVNAGLEFSYVLGSHKERGEYREAVLQLQELQAQTMILKRKYHEDREALMANSAMIKEMIIIKEENISFLNTIHTMRLKKLRQGLIEFDSLVDTKNSLISEQIDLMTLQWQLMHVYYDYQLLSTGADQ